MASYGWRQSRSVEDGLFAEGHRFDFMQAVHLLEMMYPDRTAPAEGVDALREVVRFRHEVRLDFPASDVELIQAPDGAEPPSMTVNLLGLAGLTGPLPPAVTELVMERRFRKDFALRDFLDIFNHRLISLFYRARKKYRPSLDPRMPIRTPEVPRGPELPEDGRMARVLFSFLGLGTPHLRGRMQLPDRALLPYAGLFIDQFRSTEALARILRDYFDAGVEISEFHGKWHNLEADDVTRIGRRRGQNRRLGRDAVLGTRVWNVAASFEVRVGPLTYAQFLSFLPTGRAFRPLIAAVRFFVSEELDFTIRLMLKAADVPRMRLGHVFLGWTTWLRSTAVAASDAQVRLGGRI
jgi:type VI secretion system protein ImpH